MIRPLDHNKHPVRKSVANLPSSCKRFGQVHEVAALIRKGKFPDSDDWITISHTKEWGYVIFQRPALNRSDCTADKAVRTWVYSDAPLPRKELFRRFEIAAGEREEIKEPRWFKRINSDYRDS